MIFVFSFYECVNKYVFVDSNSYVMWVVCT
uniref:Uncharacterized protein n=1 Tax=Arundo donax TaxID=35708 RepID=A0A0A9CNH2_ARUDO